MKRKEGNERSTIEVFYHLALVTGSRTITSDQTRRTITRLRFEFIRNDQGVINLLFVSPRLYFQYT